MTEEIAAQELNTDRFIEERVDEIRAAVGEGMAINALSGGVDSSAVTLLGHRALGKQLRTVFIDNGLMREQEPDQVVDAFEKLGVPVEIVDARAEFFAALERVTDPEAKREAVTQTFYRDVFGRIVRESGAK
ncbi:MAG: ExsB family transcriptional regulator, partial [Gemmatimonadota bacterium]